MTKKKAANETKLSTVVANDPNDLNGMLKNVGGSRSDHWNNILANQTVQALWLKHSDPEMRDKQFKATVAALMSVDTGSAPEQAPAQSGGELATHTTWVTS
jgi:hypothetical protein